MLTVTLRRVRSAADDFRGDINIQADVSGPFKVLKKVMYSANQAGYFNINFAVIAGAGAGTGETEDAEG